MEWRKIPNFPNYSVSNSGLVRNDWHDRMLTTLVNEHGILHVGMMRDGVQWKRSVAVMVARSFLPEPKSSAFNTPINLDGDKTNCRAENLMWRPLWFARKYTSQFALAGFEFSVEEISSKTIFETAWDAAIHYGVLVKEIYISTISQTYVWPIYKTFRRIE